MTAWGIGCGFGSGEKLGGRPGARLEQRGSCEPHPGPMDAENPAGTAPEHSPPCKDLWKSAPAAMPEPGFPLHGFTKIRSFPPRRALGLAGRGVWDLETEPSALQ